MEQQTHSFEADEKRQLVERAEGLRDEVAEALAREGDLRCQVGPRLEADYQVKIGCYEIERFEAELACRRAKRRLSLVQQAANRGEKPDHDAIEGVLDGEFSEWEERAEAAMRAFSASVARRTAYVAMGEADSEELKSLYRGICKRLHPDLNPGAGKRDAKLLKAAMAAYAIGNLETLRAIAVAVGEEQDGLSGKSAVEIEAEVALLEAQRKLVLERIDALMLEHPFNLSEKLADGDWVRARVAEIRQQTEKLAAAKAECDRRAKAAERAVA